MKRLFFILILCLCFFSCSNMYYKDYALINFTDYEETVTVNDVSYTLKANSRINIAIYSEPKIIFNSTRPVHGVERSNVYSIVNMRKNTFDIRNSTSQDISFTVKADYNNGTITIPANSIDTITVYGQKICGIDCLYKFYTLTTDNDNFTLIFH